MFKRSWVHKYGYIVNRPWHRSPSDRIHAVLCRLTSHNKRVIHATEAVELAERMASLWSRMPGAVMRAFYCLSPAHQKEFPGWFARGKYCSVILPSFDELEKQAKADKAPFVDLAIRQFTRENRVRGRIRAVRKTSRFINQLKQEVDHGRKNPEHRAAT